MIRKILYAILVLILAGSVSFFILRKVRAPRESSPSEQQKVLVTAAQLLKENKSADAILLLMEHKNIAFNQTNGATWIALLADAYAAQHDRGRLTFLYDYFPAFQVDEQKGLLIAQRYLELNRLNDFLSLRDKFRETATKKAEWLALDARHLFLLGREGEAEQLLKSSQFEGAEESYRLTQLALLEIKRNPQLAIEILTKALTLDPHNLQALLIRGGLFESNGLLEIARLDYTTALQSEPHNIFYADTLAEFFRRENKISLAQQIWSTCLNNPASAEIWIKSLFWNKVAIDQGKFWENAKIPQGAQEPLIDYLINLPPNQFWSWEIFEKLPFAQQYLQTEQVTFWLRILELIRQKDRKTDTSLDQELLQLIRSSPFLEVAYDPLLVKALTIVATYRSTSTLPPEGLLNFQPLLTDAQEKMILNSLAQRHYIFEQLHTVCREQNNPTLKKRPQDGSSQESSSSDSQFLNFLKSDKAYSALFLAAGWLRSASLLTDLSVPFPSDTPPWFSFGMAQCIRVQEGAQKAFDWLQKQPSSMVTDLLLGELALEAGATREGIERIQKVLKTATTEENAQVNYRASFLLANTYMEQNELDKAQDTIEKNQQLLSSTLGKELLARIALLKGNIDLAKRLYLSVINSSVEAKSFMAQDALTRGDLQKAIELTKQLLMKYPSNAIIQLNYQKLLQLQQKKSSSQNDKEDMKQPIKEKPAG